MSNYSLYPFKEGGRYLVSKEEYVTDEYMPKRFETYLTDHLVTDGEAKYYRYRLRTSDMMRFTDTLDYDIECPRCHDKLRLCGMPVDAYTHGLYKCRRCDDKTDGRI